MGRVRFLCVYSVFIAVVSVKSADNELYISNLDDNCYRCLCYAATECNLSIQCVDGYCGPFKVSHVYWAEAGKQVFAEDDWNRTNAWRDCALNYYCAKRIVGSYLNKFGRDCNSDGVTDCYDYMMIHYNGGYGCSTPLNESENGQIWMKRYEKCTV